ncbi:two pore domain potassium channel family protein [Microbacterium sp. 4R-513]|uniref:potassium channel family protein n=1 Tax=Microbacterium sp. 4R-513 TaxID=2567934 RepID=UPI0013E1C127|nr:potassium channel family protein [Microbacterium sp. 4R-513]QIG39084.1 two pore domain potassium channel family protein [Microbacterium sp. 4R-513]
MARERMTSERWAQLTHWPLIVASLLWLTAYSWKVIGDVTGPGAIGLWVVIGATYLTFVVDYLVRLMLARPRAPWFRAHLLDLAIVAIPMLRMLRLLRVMTSFTFGQQTAGTLLRSRIAIYGAGASMLVIYLCALAVLEAERGSRGANIVSFGDAIWWAFVTVATVGYGDYYPVTPLGRMWAVGLMAGGIAIVGTVTATVSSWVIEKAARGRDDDEPATRAQVRGLLQQVGELRKELADARDGTKE